MVRLRAERFRKQKREACWSSGVASADADRSLRHRVKSGAPVKVGFSRRPVGRLTDLQISSPIELRFHLVCWLADKKEAIALEQRCHQMLIQSGRHLRSEWFNIPPIEAAKVIDRASLDVACNMVPHKELVRRFPSSKDPLAGYFWTGDAA
jgi:hypothetical protein